MATERKRGLGRGLDALLGIARGRGFAEQPSEDVAGNPTVLRLDQMAPAYQPRAHTGEGAIQELAESIKLQGSMQPIPLPRLNA